MAIVIHNLSLLVQNYDEEKLTKELDACLVNAQEIDADWQQFEDPYQWQIRPAR